MKVSNLDHKFYVCWFQDFVVLSHLTFLPFKLRFKMRKVHAFAKTVQKRSNSSVIGLSQDFSKPLSSSSEKGNSVLIWSTKYASPVAHPLSPIKKCFCHLDCNDLQTLTNVRGDQVQSRQFYTVVNCSVCFFFFFLPFFCI